MLHSGRVLQAMTYAPTGAVVAAPTTSLPESIGGTRNWDYRFCWVRDASLTLEALWVAACPDEADGFFRFLATAAGSRLRPGSALQILYGVGGERLVPEHELEHLAGYRDSSPVRVGNGAWDQSQLDVYGELLNAAWLLADQIGTFDEFTARFLVDAAETAAQRWNEPDQGIWEIRGAPRHFVHSKLMCWVALDRAIRLAPQLPIEAPVERWREVRDEIRTAIEEQGWSASASSFTQAFGSDELDASVLMLFITGFLPPSDPRMRATVDAVVAGLSDEAGFLYRYRSDDGLGGDEGTFAICTFWLAQCLADLGDVEPAARALRAPDRVRERRGAPRRRDRSGHRRAPGQLPPGLHPHRPGERGLGDRPRRRPCGQARRAARRSARVLNRMPRLDSPARCDHRADCAPAPRRSVPDASGGRDVRHRRGAHRDRRPRRGLGR